MIKRRVQAPSNTRVNKSRYSDYYSDFLDRVSVSRLLSGYVVKRVVLEPRIRMRIRSRTDKWTRKFSDTTFFVIGLRVLLLTTPVDVNNTSCN